MKKITSFFLIGAFAMVALAPCPLSAQLTREQRISEFKALANLYAKRYGPYEWKRDVLQFDLYDLSPWIAKVSAAKTDLELYDQMSLYVNSLNDAHDVFRLPSNFVVSLNFFTDIYDGKLIIDSINRTRLPAEQFGFYEGYELVSIDDADAQTLLDRFMRFGNGGNTRTTRRFAAELVTYRPQGLVPSAADAPEISTVVMRNPEGGLETFRIPWTRTGVPLTSVGRFPTPKGEVEAAEADYLDVFQRLNNCRIPNRSVIEFGSIDPVFVNALPANFSFRLGSALDDFLSGTFTSGGMRLGYIRIPYFDPVDANAAITAFAKEIAYFQANTDGLIVDITRNPGGSSAYANALLSYLIPRTWTSVGFEVRATTEWVYLISSALQSAQAAGAPAELIELYQQIKGAIIAANRAQRGRTDPISLDNLSLVREPATDSRGNVLAYRKPMLLLMDEMSASGSDMFAATLQDNSRARLFGYRTMGAGGNVESWAAGVYSQGQASVTESLMSRPKEVVTPDFPVTRYIENVGVRPDIEFDYMTVENFRKRGALYVEAFTKAMIDQIRNANPTEVKP